MVFKKVVSFSIVACMSCLLVFQPVSPSVAQTEDGYDAPPITLEQAQATLTQQRGFFTENKGQWDESILFMGDTEFGRIIFRQDQIQYQLIRAKEVEEEEQDSFNQFDPYQAHDDYVYPNQKKPKNFIYESYVLSLRHPGSKPSSIQGKEETGTLYNYFIGNDPDKWGTGCKAYRQIVYTNLWEGIDLQYYFSPDGLKYDFIVSPMADETQLKVEIEGATLEIAENATHAELHTPFGAIVDAPLYSYGKASKQSYHISFKAMEVNAGTMVEAIQPSSDAYPGVLQMGQFSASFGMEFSLPSATLSFDGIPPAPRKESIVIDPLIQSTYLGGEGNDSIKDLLVAPDGSIYVAGGSSSAEFPGVHSGYQNLKESNYDGFIANLTSDLTRLISSTYIGGKADPYWNIIIGQEVNTIAISNHGFIYVAGTTRSHDFPITPNAAQPYFSGGGTYGHYCAFVSKFNLNLNALESSTYLGGSNDDCILSLAIDHENSIFVAGLTTSKDFNSVEGGFLDEHIDKGRRRGFSDSVYSNMAFMSNLSEDLSEVRQSTYYHISGCVRSQIKSLLISKDGYILASGEAFDSSSYAYYGLSGFITKMSKTLKSQSSYYVINNRVMYENNTINSISIDKDGIIYAAGFCGIGRYMRTTTLPNSASGYQEKYPAGEIDYSNSGFIMKFNSDLAVIQSTFLGGTENTSIDKVIVAPNNRLYVVGRTISSDFPTTSGVFQKEIAGSTDVFISCLSIDLKELHHSTLFGGSKDDFPSAIFVTIQKVLIAGTTYSDDYPVNKNSFQSVCQGSTNGFVSRLSLNLKGIIPRSGDEIPDPNNIDPNAPKNLRAMASDHCIYLKWDIPQSTPSETIYIIYRKGIYENYCSPISMIGSVKRSDIAKLSYSISQRAYYIDYEVDYDVTYEYYITQTKPDVDETGYSEKASAIRMYPTLLVHGFQFLDYNPILYSRDLISKFTGQNLRLTQTGNMIFGYEWNFDRKKEYDEKRQEFIEMEHLATRTLKNALGLYAYDEHYLIKINRLDLDDNAYTPNLQNVYVSDYSYRTYISKSREDRDCTTKYDYDPTAVYCDRAQTRDYIQVFARNLKREIDAIKRQTEASKVNIIAHSMGGLVARTYIEEKAFDSKYANDIRANKRADISENGERHGLPEYGNDVHRLIMCGTPNHGTPTSSDFFNQLADLKNNKCGPQMTIDSIHLQILNYEEKFEFKNNCNSTYDDRIFIKKEDKLVNGVHYHMLAGIMPEVYSYNLWQKIWMQNENKKREILEGIVSKQVEEAEKVLRVGENYVYMGDLSDKSQYETFQPKVLVNYGRLYNNSVLSNQSYYMNHIMYHADHSQVYRNRTSFNLISNLLQGITESTDPYYYYRTHQILNPTSYWNFYGQYSFDDLKKQEELIKKVYSAELLKRIKEYLKLPFGTEKNYLMTNTADEEQEIVENLVKLNVNNGTEYTSVGPFEHVWNTTETAFVDHINGNIQWFNPTFQQTSYQIEGLTDNIYSLRLTSLDFEASDKAFKVFDLYQMPTKEHQTDHIHINWDTQEIVFESDFDGDGEIDRTLTPPGAPSGLSASVNHRHVQLNWQRAQLGSNGIRGYRVYRASPSSSEFAPIAFINTQRPMSFEQHIVYMSNGGNGFSYTDSTGLPGESYTYYVVAEDDQQFNSLSSNMVQVGPLTAEPFVHLRISAEVNKPTFFKGEETLMQVMVVNQGAATASNSRVAVTIPSETSFVRATRYRSRVLAPTMIEIEIGAIAGHSVQSFQIDLSVNTAVSQPRSLPVHFDVTCTEKSSDFTHVLLQLIPQRSGRPDLYLGLYYRNAQWDPLSSSLFISQDTPLEIDFVLTGAQLPYSLKLDWGDGEQLALGDQRDTRQTLRHAFKSKGKMTIKIQVTDQLQRSKTATLHMEVR